MGKKYMDTKEKTLESAILGIWKEAAKKNEDKLDPVNKDAVKKKFDDRKDKDIDNDGDVDSSDKYLHKRRKAVSKAVKNEELDLDEGKMSQIDQMMKDGKSAKEIAKALKMDVKAVKKVMGEAYEIGTDEYRDYVVGLTPGEDAEWAKARDFKVQSMKEALAKVWGMKEGKNPFKKEEDEEPVKKKGGKTDTGKKMAEIEVDPTIKEKK